MIIIMNHDHNQNHGGNVESKIASKSSIEISIHWQGIKMVK